MRESLHTQVIIWVSAILILGWFNVGMKAIGWYIDPNGIKNKTILKYPYPTCIIKLKNPHHICQSRIKRRWYQSNTGLDFTKFSWYTYHIVVLKTSSPLEKSCYSKCIVLHWSMWHSLAPVLKPTRPVFQIKNNKLDRVQPKKSNDISSKMTSLERSIVPAVPIFRPKDWFCFSIWCPLITIVTITGVNLHKSRCYVRYWYPSETFHPHSIH